MVFAIAWNLHLAASSRVLLDGGGESVLLATAGNGLQVDWWMLGHDARGVERVTPVDVSADPGLRVGGQPVQADGVYPPSAIRALGPNLFGGVRRWPT
jgi:hypothetical protein